MKILALGICGLLALTASTTASAAQPTVLKLEQFRRGVGLRVEVGGKERLFQFDTGGGNTFISPEIAKELACEKGARVVGFRMTGDKLEAPRCDDVPLTIGGHRFTIPTAGVYQVGEFNAKGVTVDGLVALDIFEGRTITMDFASLKLNEPAPARRRALAQAKFQLGQSMRFVGQQCIQLHGGIGVTDEYSASHYFKRLTVMEMSYGDAMHQLGEVSARMQDTAGVFA